MHLIPKVKMQRSANTQRHTAPQWVLRLKSASDCKHNPAIAQPNDLLERKQCSVNGVKMTWPHFAQKRSRTSLWGPCKRRAERSHCDSERSHCDSETY